MTNHSNDISKRLRFWGLALIVLGTMSIAASIAAMLLAWDTPFEASVGALVGLLFVAVGLFDILRPSRHLLIVTAVVSMGYGLYTLLVGSFLGPVIMLTAGLLIRDWYRVKKHHLEEGYGLLQPPSGSGAHPSASLPRLATGPATPRTGHTRAGLPRAPAEYAFCVPATNPTSAISKIPTLRDGTQPACVRSDPHASLLGHDRSS